MKFTKWSLSKSKKKKKIKLFYIGKTLHTLVGGGHKKKTSNIFIRFTAKMTQFLPLTASMLNNGNLYIYIYIYADITHSDHLCSTVMIPELFPYRVNLCFEHEVERIHLLKVQKKENIIRGAGGWSRKERNSCGSIWATTDQGKQNCNPPHHPSHPKK